MCFFFFLVLSVAMTYKERIVLSKGKKSVDQLNFLSFCITDTKNEMTLPPAITKTHRIMSCPKLIRETFNTLHLPTNYHLRFSTQSFLLMIMRPEKIQLILCITCLNDISNQNCLGCL